MEDRNIEGQKNVYKRNKRNLLPIRNGVNRGEVKYHPARLGRGAIARPRPARFLSHNSAGPRHFLAQALLPKPESRR